MENLTQPKTQELNAIADKLNHLNLDPIKIKLMDKEEGEGWTREQVDSADLMYRRFLFLNAKYPEQVIVPSNVVDKFWHTHILDTRKYQDDCEFVFGYFIHHFPYLGMRGVEDEQHLKDSFEQTKELFLQEFGQPLLAFNNIEDSSNPCKSEANCWPEKCNAKCNVKKSEIDNMRPSFANNPTGTIDIFEGLSLFVEEVL